MRTSWLLLVPALLGSASAAPCDSSLCSCAGRRTPAEALQSAAAVFRGTVVGARDTLVRLPGADGRWRMRVVRLRVESAWKGVSAEEVSVLTGSGGGDCGFPFRTGHEYLVYAHQRSGSSSSKTTLGTSICSRTASIDRAAEDLRALGPPSWTLPATH